MRGERGWGRILPARLRPRGVAEEVDAELAFHLAMRAEEYAGRGLGDDAARAEALRRMGDLDRVRGACRTLAEARERDMRRAEWWDEFRQDLRFGARQLLRTRGLAAVAVLTLALGIGATAAIFGVVDAVVLRPLPFEAPERVVRLRADGGGVSSVSNANFLDWRAQARSFTAVTAAVRTGATLTGRDVPLLLNDAQVSADYFRVFGVRPMLGRTFLPEDDMPGAAPVVVLGARAWARYFASDTGVVGRTLSLDGLPYTVIGVMPPSFDYVADAPEAWVPLALTPEERAQRGASYLDVYARLRPGVTLAEAQAEISAISRRIAQEVDSTNSPDDVLVRPFAEDLVGDYRGRLLTLLGAVGFVLLISCANVANLLLARGAARTKELAIRGALGAGRRRLVRQLLTESLVLALLGGAAGALLAVLGVRGLVAIGPEDVPRLDQARVDGRVLLFTLVLAVVSSVVFGLAPALRSARASLQGALREGGRTGAAGVRDRLRGGLVAAEVAMALLLLTGAGLLTRSALLLHRVEPGFDATGVLTARILLPAETYPTGEQVVRAYQRILDEARRAPEVASAGLTLMIPLAADNANAAVSAEGQPFTEENRRMVNFRFTSGGYFATMGIPLRHGREFTRQDVAGSPRVAIINETLARKLFGDEPAVGRRITGLTAEPEDPQWSEVVGVVGDIRDAGLGAPTVPEVYYPVAQAPPAIWPLLQRSLVLVARAKADDAAALERPLREAVARVDRDLPTARPRTMESYVAESLATSRFSTLLLGTLSAIGLVLAVVGIYGVIAYFVTQRVPEIGVRIALGATPRSVLALVVRSGLRPVVLGVAVGLVASFWLTRLLAGLLYGVTPNDPATVVGVVLLLVGAAVLASLVPARRATRVDPARVLQG
jgi:predicted permease